MRRLVHSFPPRLRTVLRLGGSFLVLVALAAVWAARLRFVGDTYVSGLGSEGTAGADVFNGALGLIALGGAMVALGVGARAPHGRGAGVVSTCLLTASGFFAISALVPCSAGCPLPFSAAAEFRDLAHTVAAVIGFALTGIAILATMRWSRAHARLAIPSMAVVILASATGGLLSLAQVATSIGGWLELVATTAALAWLVALALHDQSLADRAVSSFGHAPVAGGAQTSGAFVA